LQEERNLFNVKVRNSRAISLLVPPFLYFPSQYRPARLALFLNVAVSGLAVNGPVEHRQNQARRCRLGDNGKAISGLLNRGTVRDGTSAHSLAQARPKTISRACELEGTKGQPNGTPRRKVPTRGTDLKPKIDNSSRPIESVSSSGVEEAHLSASQPYPTGTDAAPIEVLLVEDSPGDVRLTREAFKDAKVHINLHVASDGTEAMAFLGREGEHANVPRPDLILLNLNLPKKDGFRKVVKSIDSFWLSVVKLLREARS
jgi:hypothetical protein